MAEAVGPVFTGGFEEIAVGEGNQKYSILFLPDKHNDELQREGKAPVYYWMPNMVRIAKRGDDYKFHLVHFVGRRSDDTSIGVDGTQEVAGGVFSVTTTAAFPEDVMRQAQEALLNRFRGQDLRYWGWRTNVAPMFRPMLITANQTAITNLAPLPDGSAPASAPRFLGPGASKSMIMPRAARSIPGVVPHGRAFRAPTNLDAWYWKLQGQGPGSIVPTGENAFSGLIGSLPTAILWQGFHGAFSPIVVSQAMKLKVWSQAIHLHMEGHWDRIFEHFSADLNARGWWWHADVQIEFNKMLADGTITVQLEIDTTLPNADQLQQEINKHKVLVYQQFMEAAKKMIFDPEPPKVEPAKASGGGIFGWGGGVALKYRRDTTQLNLVYDEVIDQQYLQDHVISSSLEGFYNEIKADPANEKKYFTTLYLDDWERAVHRVVRPIVNWPDASKKWIGEPVDSLAIDIGYPTTNGSIAWGSNLFTATDAGDTSKWEYKTSRKAAGDVATPPEGWTPDTTYVRRRVLFQEPPGESDSPYFHAAVERNSIELDPGELGTPMTNNIIEIRADSVGKLEVGPISLNVDLETSKQTVEVSFQAKGKTADGLDRNITKFTWSFDDQATPRYWEIFTGQLDFVPNFRYQVRAIVKGGLLTRGMEWTGPWVDVSGNGPLMVSVPTPEDAGVTRKNIVPRQLPAIQGGGTGKPQVGVGRPPSRNMVGVGSPSATKTVVGNGAPKVHGYSLWPKTGATDPVPVDIKDAPGNGDMGYE
jgi:hypothetical protein